jgi:hypothetical protein
MVMRTNTSVTLYEKSISNRAEVWTRSVIPAAEWENADIANSATFGVERADKVTIFAPLGVWEIQPEDILVKGTVTDAIGAQFTISDLRAKYPDTVVVRSANKLDFGSTSMHHWEIGAN